MSNIKLKNQRYERFCIEYVKTLNATQSAIEARYNKKTARVKGSQLLTIVSIQKRVQKLSQPKDNKTTASAEEVLTFLSDTMRGITSGLDNDTGEQLKVPIKDKLKAAELLGKRHALFTERVEHAGNNGRTIKINIVPDKGD